MSAATESELERQVREEQERHDSEQAAAHADGTSKGEDPDTGKIFDVPRVGILTDDSDPSAISLSFSGAVKLDRAVASDVELYNKLKHGKSADLRVTVHVGSINKTHRRDKEGDVDAIVENKALIVHSIELDE